ncbi:hypothetical protein [Georgenia faecalis]|uniref:hypothetical protein n=1 Tax=Georgenia faecalis TaxID=2483799 RepID=UPI000FD7779E|nr:hypothetical protein [Georgenia faecalis]
MSGCYAEATQVSPERSQAVTALVRSRVAAAVTFFALATYMAAATTPVWVVAILAPVLLAVGLRALPKEDA